MKLELAYKIYTHRVLCTLEKKTANLILHFLVKEGNVFIYVLYSIHKIKNKLGAWGKIISILILRLQKISLEPLKKDCVM